MKRNTQLWITVLILLGCISNVKASGNYIIYTIGIGQTMCDYCSIWYSFSLPWGDLNTLSQYAIVQFEVHVTHPSVSELKLSLISPSGTEVVLVDHRGGNRQYVFDGTNFMDSATYSGATYPFTSDVAVAQLRPEQSLTAFRGTTPLGTWRFKVEDNVAGNAAYNGNIVLRIQDGCLQGNPCDNGGTCITTGSASYTCNCLTGYQNPNCQDVNECATNNGGCHAQATCTNTQGSFTCTCKTGYSGNGFSCTAVYCPLKSNDGNAEWDQTFAIGQIVNGSCINGYYGTVSRTCTQSGSNGNWGSISGSCDAVYCSPIPNDENAEWDQTLANGQVINGSCFSGYQGPISRTCTQSGSTGNWGLISGSCDDINECSINNGGCNAQAICTNTIGSYECHCKPGYYGNGIECSPCAENEYSFNETTCLPCPENTTIGLASSSIIDCKCTSFNHYLNLGNLTCLPCDYGFKVDELLNICQKVKCPTLSLNGSEFESTEIGKTEYSTCAPNYYVFQSDLPYSPIPNVQGEAICLLNDDKITASWNIIQVCEPTCLIREGKCDNNQICAQSTGENIERCFCAGFTGKYCENIDFQGCKILRCSNNGTCIDKTDTSAAYCKCDGTGYEGPFCENDINDCVANVTCLNGGTCIDYGVNKTVCLCPLGFVGAQCELCTPNTCKNGGDCVIQNRISSCNCFGTGFEGNFCEISKNDCKTLTCLQGICVELGNDARKCSCLPGYEGSRCEIPKEDCRKNGCGIGRCITVSQNDIAYCDCFGTGYEGESCEISKNDCKTLTCLQGLCIELGNDTRKCSCLPGYEGDRCQILKEDCRKNGCGEGKCVTIPQSDTAYCNCQKTGYEGDFCEKEKDCRSKKCLNNGECRIDYDNDSAKCICKDEFKGDICEMEKYSTVDQLTVYYFLGPIFIIYLLVCVGIFTQARKADKETRKSWIFFLLRFLMSCLGIFDLLTDIFFIIQSYDYGVENNNFGFFWSSLIFTILPWSLAAICTGIFLVAWKKKLNSTENNNNFVIFSFFTVVSLLSANGVETFHLVTQYLFLKEGKVIEVSDYAGYLTIYFIIKTFIEDFPQLITQGIFQSRLGKADAIVTLSLASSAISCFITAVTFPFTHEFDYLKHKIKRLWENQEQPSKEQLFQMQ